MSEDGLVASRCAVRARCLSGLDVVLQLNGGPRVRPGQPCKTGPHPGVPEVWWKAEPLFLDRPGWGPPAKQARVQHRSDAWMDIRPQAVSFSVRTAPRSRSACSTVCIVSCGLRSCGGKGILPMHMRALAGLHNREFRGAGTKRLAATWGHKRWLHKLT